MTKCQHCHAVCQLYLCKNCTIQLANMLADLPWLLDELDARIQRLDRITLGTIGRTRRPDELNIIDFDAAETARKVRATLLKWVETVAERHTGRRPPALGTIHTKNLARWLEANVDAIARLDLSKKGRHPLYDDINHLVGTDQRGGQLVTAINRTERHFAGPCPTIRSHNSQGEPVECGEILYADIDERTVECPSCKQKIDVEENRRKTREKRDLRTHAQILEVLDNIGEPITKTQLDHWIKARRLRQQGWLHDHEIVPTRINANSQPVYSFTRAQKLRRRDNRLTQRRNTLAEQQ